MLCVVLLSMAFVGAAQTTARADTVLPVPTGLITSPAPVGGVPGDTCGAQEPYGYVGKTITGVVFGAATAATADGSFVGVEFSVTPSDGTGPYDVTSGQLPGGSTGRVTLPPSDFADGVTYTWQARESNGSGTVSDWSSPCHFITDLSTPPMPTLTSTDFPAEGSGQLGPVVRTTGTVQVAVSGPGASDTVAIKYGLNDQDLPVGGGPQVPVGPDGTATITIRPTEFGPNTLWVQGVSRAGDYGPEGSYSFFMRGLTTPDARGDLDGDGHADLVAAGQDGDLHVLYGNGDGTLQSAVTYPDSTTAWNDTIVAQNGDLDGDGYQDLLKVNHYGAMSLARNNGLGDFGGQNQESTGYRSDGSEWNAATQIILPGDFDGDGFATDVLSVENGDLLFWPGGYAIVQGTDTVIGTGFAHKTVLAAGDLTGDGVPDLLVRDDNGGTLQLAPGKGDGTLAPECDWTTVAHGLRASDYPLLTIAGDANGDGVPDLYATTAAGGLDFFPGTGAGHFGIPAPVTGTGIDWSTVSSIA